MAVATENSELMGSLVRARERKEQLEARMFAHFYLNESGLCLSCTAVFKLADGPCPACGADTVFQLAKWISPDGAVTAQPDWREQHSRELKSMR